MYSVHKANIPIAKYRNAIADQEADDSSGLRMRQMCNLLKGVFAKNERGIGLMW